MEIRDSLSIKNGKYAKRKHRHSRPKFNPLTNYKKQIDCQKDDVEKQKSFFVKIEHEPIYKFKLPTYLKQLRIVINQQSIGYLSHKFIDLYDAINRSKYILDFKDNWDENGSKAYLPDTWVKAVRFLIKFYSWRDQHFKLLVKPPKIYQGPEGSIDIYWKSQTFTYLINIGEEEEFATYYYKSPTGTKVEGEFNLINFNVDELQTYFEPSFI
jgi:hypothetical protein